MGAVTILESRRLLIQQATIKDYTFFIELMNSPKWLKYIGNRGINNKRDALAYIKNSLVNSYKSNGWGLYKLVLKDEMEPIGVCGFLKRDYLEHPDLGFAILPAYEGCGISFEAASAMMKYGFSELKINPILAITSPENISSQNLLVKLGFKNIDRITATNYGDSLLYSYAH